MKRKSVTGILLALLLAACLVSSGCLGIPGLNGLLGGGSASGTSGSDNPAGGKIVHTTQTTKVPSKAPTQTTVRPTKTPCRNCVSGESGAN